MHAKQGQGADMRLNDLAFANIPAGLEGSSERGTRGLLRDIVCVGLMVEDRPSAADRVDASIGRELAKVVRAAIVGPGPAHGIRSHRAA
jgi:hypothetical protein